MPRREQKSVHMHLHTWHTFVGSSRYSHCRILEPNMEVPRSASCTTLRFFLFSCCALSHPDPDRLQRLSPRGKGIPNVASPNLT